jgi:transcriptional regulator with XRE-family HTH domain
MSSKYIGLVLRARRNEIRLSQVKMGVLLDVSTTTISMVENGKSKIAFHRIPDYLEAYRLSSDCYPIFVKLLHPIEWEHLLIIKEQLGEPWRDLDNEVEVMIDSGQFK